MSSPTKPAEWMTSAAGSGPARSSGTIAVVSSTITRFCIPFGPRLAADPETDGAWKVTLALPIEAVRLAVSGPRALGDGDKGPAVVVVEGVTAKPAVGWKILGVEAATLWVTDVPAWAKDAPRVKAKSAKAGTIEVTGIDATPATLFVIITKP